MKLESEKADISSIFAHFEKVDLGMVLEGRIPLGMRDGWVNGSSTKRAIPSECF
ncbi:MAG: hypothetical protein FWG98_11825 [Candidatus Cloacimonetes bacterium]|nr:hypothetical protein [Candidatus Cloacimonadota bacterium]